jgi:hypothetical protein
MAALRVLRRGLVWAIVMSAAACGGGGDRVSGTVRTPTPPTPASNVAAVTVDGGPSNNSVNTLFVSVTVCAPGSTTSCQTIDHIQVDTGSYGLRLLAPVLSVSLPVVTLSGGGTLAECTQFVDGYSWGPIETADIQIGGEKASGVPLQAIGDSRYSNVPTDCSSTGPAENTVATFGANGILGIGPFASDCPGCGPTQVIPTTYYTCSSATSCADSAVPVADIVPNPVTRFATNNNGSIIVLPAVPNPATGELTLTGSLIFGIDTQSNNASGTQTVLTVDSNANLLVTFNGSTLANSFIDSGSNGIYFTDTALTPCTANGLTHFYCPSSTVSLALSIQGVNGAMANNLTFNVANAQTYLNANPTFNVFPELAGTNPGQGSFDYGLAFFYGRRVAVAVQGATTTVGIGPYIAF